MRSAVYAFVLAIFCAAATSASASTTIYATGFSNVTGDVVSPGNFLGAADGTTGLIGNGLFSTGGLTLSFSEGVTGAGLTFTAAQTGFDPFTTSRVFVAIGEVVSGVATFSAETSFIGSGGGTFNLDLSGQCSAISGTGCSLVSIRTEGGGIITAINPGFALDGISGVSAAPEPSAWALMILAFAATGWRLKVLRKQPQFAANFAYA